MHDIRSFGAIAGGTHTNTGCIQAAIDAAAADGGGAVLIPGGTWLSGALVLRSNTRLYLEAGAVLLGSTDPAEYPLIESRWEGSTRTSFSPLIGGSGLENTGIEGRGTIDGQGAFWWDWFRSGGIPHPRPRLIAFTDCTHVFLQDFTARNSPSWTINPVRCADVHISGIAIHNPPDSPNTDGINPDSCRLVRISDCLVNVGDDCITLKAGTEREKPELRAPCEDICISNCILEHGHGGIVIGSEMSGDVRDVVISNCICKGTDRGIRIKSRRGRGGIIENISVSNMIMTGVLTPLAINLYYGCGAWGNTTVSDKAARPVDEGTPRIRNIRFQGIQARDSKLAAGFIYGLPESPIENLQLHQIDIAMDAAWTKAEPAEMADGLSPLCRAGIWVRNVRGLDLSQVRIHNCAGAELDFDHSVSQH